MSVLQDMIDDAPDQIDAIDSSLSQIQDQIDDLTTQINGITNELCSVAESELTLYMEGPKLVELELLYGGMFVLPFWFDLGANYGSIDYINGGITDWQVLDDLGFLVYSYEGMHWDADPIIIKLVTDFAFANDYLTIPLTGGATYGLIPSRDALDTAKDILTNNKTKIENSKTIFEDYA